MGAFKLTTTKLRKASSISVNSNHGRQRWVSYRPPPLHLLCLLPLLPVHSSLILAQRWVLFAAALALRNSKNMCFRAIHRHCLCLRYFFHQLEPAMQEQDLISHARKEVVPAAKRTHFF